MRNHSYHEDRQVLRKMEDIIAALTRIEEQAEMITKEAEEERKNLQRDIDEGIRKIARLAELDTMERVRERKEAAHAQYVQKTEEIERENKIRSEALQKAYDERHAQWEESIFNRIIGG